MMTKLQKQLINLSKQLCYVFILQLVAIQLMVAAPSVSQSIEKVKVNVDTKNAGLIEVFSVVEKQTDFVFIYNQEVRENRSKFNFDLKEISVADLLRKIAESTDFRFKQINSNITVTKKEADSTEKENTDSVIIGKVIDESTGEALVGVNVLVKGTTKGSITDVDGNFRLEASEDATLVFSFIGYETQEVSIGTRTEFNVALKASSDELSEVVIVGYGIQEKSDVTGVVNSVNSEDISEIPTTNPLQALKGKVSGLDIYNSGNEPGSSVSINIRGQRSIGADNSPLIILDGIPIIGGLNDISPNDIESIEILKDASATAIYGSRASNGVILITTKRGHDGKTVISYDGYYGVTNVIKKLDLMDGSQFAQLRREAERTASGAYPDDEDIFDNIALNSLVTGDYTDWQDFTFEAGHKQNHQLSLNGGSDKLQFAASGNYFDEQGIVSSSKYERTSARLNLDYQVNDKLKFGASSFASYSKQDYTAADLFDNVLRLSPLGKPYDEEGNILFRPTSDEGQRVNPLSDIANSVDERFTTRVFASFFGEYKLAKGLTYRLNVGPDAKFYKRGYFYGSETTQSQGGTSLAGTSDSDVKSITVENMLTYNKEVGKHSFGTTLVQSYQGQVTRTSSINVNDLPYDSQGYNNLGSAGEVLNVNSNYQKWELLSYTARINYKFNDRYLFTFTARADGSSRFAEGEKWGFFPSAAVAWRLSDEPFLADVDMLSNLKLRASYGETGNTAISPYQTFSTLEESSYVFGTTGAAGFQPGTISNPNLKWETTKQLNAGIEFAFWDTRVSGSVDYYMAKTDDLLLSRSLPSSSGFTDVFENIGATENKGVDIQLSFKNITSSNNGFQWQTDLTFSKNNNKITELFGDGTDDIGNGWFIGHPINTYFDYQKVGIWQTEETDVADSYGYAPGDIKLKDVNEDGQINADDRVILGSSTPSWIGGMTNRFSYKGVALSIVFHVRQNYLIQSQWYNNNNRLAGRYNNLDVDYWTPENPTNDNPRPDVNQESVNNGSTLMYRDASFVRVRNIALSYNFPEHFINQIGLNTFRVTLTAENPLTFSSYKGFDPEFESNGERALYPSTKMYSVGIKTSF